MICKPFTLHEMKNIEVGKRVYFKLQEILRAGMGGVSETDILFVAWKW
jgi:hypothetical protein